MALSALMSFLLAPPLTSLYLVLTQFSISTTGGDTCFHMDSLKGSATKLAVYSAKIVDI
jgi:hypothetical protein